VEKLERKGRCLRKTKETDIAVEVSLGGPGRADIHTGIGFFDHMLTALALHGGLDLSLRAAGDIRVDGHHTVEDCGIALGQAIKEALGDKAGVNRFGHMLLPMDDALAQVALDLSGRPYLVFKAAFVNPMIGGYDTCLTKEFFQGLAFAAGITLHIRLLDGENDHHSCEAIFKAFGHALKQAAAFSGGKEVLSAKGVLV
jgi:imidazoleglycerol-phosphate dehydratase